MQCMHAWMYECIICYSDNYVRTYVRMHVMQCNAMQCHVMYVATTPILVYIYTHRLIDWVGWLVCWLIDQVID